MHLVAAAFPLRLFVAAGFEAGIKFELFWHSKDITRMPPGTALPIRVA